MWGIWYGLERRGGRVAAVELAGGRSRVEGRVGNVAVLVKSEGLVRSLVGHGWVVAAVSWRLGSRAEVVEGR